MAAKPARYCAIGGGLMCLLLYSTGCRSFEPTSPPLPTFRQPEALYLKAEPYARLYVEVDALEGLPVESVWLEDLRAFLAGYCDKPAGVTIGPVHRIPLAKVQGMTAEQAMAACCDGPPADAKDAAYLYVLFYHSRNMGLQERPPHAAYGYPCAILCDMAYGSPARWRAGGAMTLRHEAGHLLGLCKSRTHGDGCHCRNESCLMWPVFYVDLLTSTRAAVVKDLCAQCLRDLAAVQAGPGDPRLSFIGPVLVRRQVGYWVASGPRGIGLILDPRSRADVETGIRQVEAAMQADPRASLPPWRWWYCPAGDTAPERMRVWAALDFAREDPEPAVRRIAERAAVEYQRIVSTRPASKP